MWIRYCNDRHILCFDKFVNPTFILTSEGQLLYCQCSFILCFVLFVISHPFLKPNEIFEWKAKCHIQTFLQMKAMELLFSMDKIFLNAFCNISVFLAYIILFFSVNCAKYITESLELASNIFSTADRTNT